jgi:predicted DCC family thiol-disulfide oxidoreductase YuxK
MAAWVRSDVSPDEVHGAVMKPKANMSEPSTSSKPIVFFDGDCPLCRREIAHYRRLRGADGLVWVDVASEHAELERFGLDHAAAMARFHVRDRDERWQTGAWGFVELWSHLPAYRWLARLVRSLRLERLLDAAYTRFAAWRLRRRCDQGSCRVGGL